MLKLQHGGHQKSQCPNPPFCYCCKQSGHIAPKCPNVKVNKGIKLCAYGMPGQLFYSLNLPEEQSEPSSDIRAIVTVCEGRGTCFRISTELRYIAESEWDWKVRRLSETEFLITIPSMAVLKLLQKMGQFKFTCYDITASVAETTMEPDSFAVRATNWVRASGVPKIARKEIAMMELAYLVGDPEEVYLPSLAWKDVWIRVACRDATKIEGTSDVFINRQGYKITWHTESKLPDKPPTLDDKR